MASIAGLMKRVGFGVQPAQTTMGLAVELEREHHSRLRRYRRNWNFYEGRHWDYVTDPDDPAVTLNYVRMFADIHASMMFGGGFSVTIPDDPETRENENLGSREFIRSRLERTWDLNDKDILGLKIAQTGSITGDVFLRLSWDRDNIDVPGGYTKIEALPSQFVFPTFSRPLGTARNSISSVYVVYARYLRDMTDYTDEFNILDDNRIDIEIEHWTRDRVVEWKNGEFTTRVNVLGEIPIVHIPNMVWGHNMYGLSDVEDMIELNKELNEKSTDISAVINYQGSPTTIIKGARLGDLDRGPNNVWSIPTKDVDIENLSLNGDLNASLKYREELMQMMHEIGVIPRDLVRALGQGDQAGVALAMKSFPLQQRVKMKKKLYARGMERVNRLVLKMNALMDVDFRSEFLEVPASNRYANKVVFKEAMPRDENAELDKSEKRLRMQISSRRREMEIHGMSQGEIEKVNAEIELEALQDMDREFMVGQSLASDDQENRSGNPAPSRPNPDSQSEARSNTVERDLA